MGSTATDLEFEEYLRVHQQALFRTAYLLTGNVHQAEDVLQASLVKLYAAWDRASAAQNLDAYVRRIIINEHTSLWRRAWKRREISTDEFFNPPSHEDTYDDGVADEVWQLLSSLPRKARAVVVLRYYEQLTEPEVADLMGIAVGTVKSQCSRALATLRERTPTHLRPGQEEHS